MYRWQFLLIAAVAAGLGGTMFAQAADTDQPVSLARLPPAAGPLDAVASLKDVLGQDDVRRYRQLFAFQQVGDWRRADAVIATLDDRMLMGHVLAQRYLHPTAWRAEFEELAGWLRRFADHPQTSRIYRLAKRRRPADAVMAIEDIDIDPDTEVAPANGTPVLDRSPAGRTLAALAKGAVALRHIVRSAVSDGEPDRAAAALADAPAYLPMSQLERDRLLARTARGYFVMGDDAAAKEHAEAAAGRSGAQLPEALWTAGLASWRLNRVADAARHFSALVNVVDAAPVYVAGGAYWGARAYDALGDPERARYMLHLASEYSRSIYGLLALHMIEQRPAFNWTPPRVGRTAVQILEHSPAAQRAAALTQIGDAEGAEAELSRLSPGVRRAMTSALLVLAERTGLPDMEIRIGENLARDDGRRHDRALYPVPQWRPTDGFRVDRALLFSMVRQESRFRKYAKSLAGALGLMQIMPQTASWLEDNPSYSKGRAKVLYSPSRNLSIGQRYLMHLRERPHIENNLIYLLAAYNAGPTRLAQWQARLDIEDPMLFLESMPASETRNFVRRVLANLWVYRFRLGQNPDSLYELASGNWPQYHAHDNLDQLADLTDPT